MNGIKACEFVYWNAQAGRLLFLEAKSSIPNPRKSPDEYRIYLVARVRQLSTENRLFYTPQPSIHAGSRFLDA
jgi:hypothetical protein